MSKKLSKTAAHSSRRHSEISENDSEIRNQISPVMRRVRELLPPSKSAHHLQILTDFPLSTCQKLLCGEMKENAALLVALLRSRMGREVLLVLLDGCHEDWIVRYRKQLDLNEARRKLLESQRAIEALQEEISR